MSDPRNAAHQKKHSKGRPPKKKGKSGLPENESIASLLPSAAAPEPSGPSPALEGSQVVLSQLKDLAFHANTQQGLLAEMMLTVEEKLKQKELAASVGDAYAAQAAVHDKLTDLVAKFEAECERLQGGGA